MTDPRDTMRWVWRGSALAALLIGWVFIAWQNRFHISAPLVFVCLGYLAVVATVFNLWRTGAAAVASADSEADSTWAKPAGAVGELEREKRTLLKAIKEAEFDHEMGKLSQVDVDGMIRMYRARAIEVMKEIERLSSGSTGTTREQIMREVRARIELETKARKPDAKAGKAGKPGDKKPAAKPATDAVMATSNGAKAAEAAEPAETAASADEPTAEAVEAAEAAAPDAAEAARAERGTSKAADAARRAHEDEVLDADSTTAIEPKRDEPAKEATP